MGREIVVTRGSQITLTKAERERANIREGDKVVINVFRDTLFISKKNPNVFDKFDSFLPGDFKEILKKTRIDEKERLKRMGVI
ncbi:AbrB/MazE/SpoVT family DNA-binding domain-containing protein [Candidatus Woesearchaeota archaeon]|nr:AbrB/MazE/SpoVT family DNA-binding domain-containing protein [Candidatus Woesearchaeota archaeon]